MTRLLETTRLPVFRDAGLLWLLQGTTEQLTLLGLIGRKSPPDCLTYNPNSNTHFDCIPVKRRWSPKVLSNLFFISSLQTGTVKLVSLLHVMLRWTEHLDTLPHGPQRLNRLYAEANGMWVFALGLLFTQMWVFPILL